MQFTSDTPRGEHIVHGVTVRVPYVFNAGDVLDAEGATYLNKSVAASITNVLGTAARKWADAENELRKDKKHAAHGIKAQPSDYPLQAKLDERFALYTLSGATRAASVAADPVTKFAEAIAGAKVKELYKAKGFKYRDMLKAEDAEHGNVFNKHVAQYIEKNEWVRQLAQTQVDAMKSAASTFEL